MSTCLPMLSPLIRGALEIKPYLGPCGKTHLNQDSKPFKIIMWVLTATTN